MKTALLYKALIVFIVFPALVIAGNGNDKWKGKHTKEKTIHKEYSVNADALVKINNSYGNLNVVTWNENRVVIDITITTNGNNEDKVQNKLDGIDVVFDASNSEVYAKTTFNKSRSFWNWGNNNVNMKINYIIKMPITNSVNLNNDYGNINLDKLEGHAKINCDYGKITTKELMADNNVLNFDYTNDSFFEYIKSGKINADYSGFTIGKTNSIDINADYTKSKVEIAEEVNYNNDYGSLTIEKVNSVTGNGDYLSARLGDVYQDIDIKADYGSLKINNMAANAGTVNISSDYMKITIGFDSGYNFDFDINLGYASFNDGNSLEIMKQKVESSNKYYSGYHGNKGSGNLIKITSDYGSVTLKENN